MPKDCIHFEIAERTARQLSETRYAAPIKAAPDGLLLGAIFHDALFYAVTPKAKKLEKLAHIMHGAKGEDTYDLIRLQTKHAANSDMPMATSLLIGMVSHLFADVAMHPLVWHYSGDYYATSTPSRSIARQRHRSLESLMDMVACPDKIGNPRYNIHRMLWRQRERLPASLPLSQLGQFVEMTADETRAGLNQAWRTYAALQTAYCFQPLASLLGNLYRILPQSAAEIAALFYIPQRMEQATLLRGAIPYRHPVTGERHSTTLEELMNQAATQATRFCCDLEGAVFDGTTLDLTTPGPSLDAGLPETDTSAMRYFAAPPFPQLS